MIDPDNLTDFGRDDDALEELALFCPLTVATSGHQAARTLAALLNGARASLTHLPRPSSPFGLLDSAFRVAPFGRSSRPLEAAVREAGAWFYRMKAAALWGLVVAGRHTNPPLDLRACTRDDLCRLHGFSRKTASLFLLHSRPGWRGACLDRHVLRRLRALYPHRRVPASSPQGRREYEALEALFLRHCDGLNHLPADLDLAWWRLESAAAFRRPGPAGKVAALAVSR